MSVSIFLQAQAALWFSGRASCDSKEAGVTSYHPLFDSYHVIGENSQVGGTDNDQIGRKLGKNPGEITPTQSTTTE